MTKTLCSLLFVALEAVAQETTVPLFLEGNARIVELSFTRPSGAVRKARFLVDTGAGGFLIGSRLMGGIGAE